MIAGAGIAGLAAAIALARHGWRPLVLERAAAPHETGAGLQLGPNAVRVLGRLGLTVPLLDVALRPEALRLRDARSGRVLAEMPLAGEAERRYGAPYCVLARPALHKLLTEAALRAGVLVRYSSEIERWTLEDGTVRVEVAGGRPVVAGALIGADGLWSRVREGLAASRKPRDSARIAWRATLAAGSPALGALSASAVTAWLAPRLHAVTYPIDRAGALNLVVVTEGAAAGTGWEVPGDRDALMAIASDLAPPLGEAIGAAAGWRAWPLFETRPAVTGGVAAVTLSGDAAHPMLPFLAQGAGMAIEDAHVLGQSMERLANDLPAAFRAYEHARAARVRRVIDTARRNGTVFHLAGPLARARDMTLGALSGRALLARFDWLYGAGPVPPAQGAAYSGGR